MLVNSVKLILFLNGVRQMQLCFVVRRCVPQLCPPGEKKGPATAGASGTGAALLPSPGVATPDDAEETEAGEVTLEVCMTAIPAAVAFAFIFCTQNVSISLGVSQTDIR